MATMGQACTGHDALARSDVHAPKILNVLGAPIAVTDIASAFGIVENWVRDGHSRYVCVADVHSVMVARADGRHREVLSGADLVLPDGMPLVWTGRLRGERSLQRVCGPDFMATVCAHPRAHAWRHFFLGGADGVPERLAASLKLANPNLQVCGAVSPPFRTLSEEEYEALIRRVMDAG